MKPYSLNPYSSRRRHSGGYGSDFISLNFGPSIGSNLQIMANFGNVKIYTEKSRKKKFSKENTVVGQLILKCCH